MHQPLAMEDAAVMDSADLTTQHVSVQRVGWERYVTAPGARAIVTLRGCASEGSVSASKIITESPVSRNVAQMIALTMVTASGVSVNAWEMPQALAVLLYELIKSCQW